MRLGRPLVPPQERADGPDRRPPAQGRVHALEPDGQDPLEDRRLQGGGPRPQRLRGPLGQAARVDLVRTSRDAADHPAPGRPVSPPRPDSRDRVPEEAEGPGLGEVLLARGAALAEVVAQDPERADH
eukprot:1756658-Alexandrium_andersonii.AAC.1